LVFNSLRHEPIVDIEEAQRFAKKVERIKAMKIDGESIGQMAEELKDLIK
jgi:hypothetical protein